MKPIIIESLNPNIYQTTFTVFFAIAWGAITNVQPKWKPFESVLDDPTSSKRWWLSFRWFNMAPVLYYLTFMTVLSFPVFAVPAELPCAFRTILQTLALGACVVAAGAVFGFYRCWLGQVEQHPEKYYFVGHKRKFYTHPGKDGIKIGWLKAEYGRRNRRSGWRYIAVCSLGLPFVAGLIRCCKAF